MMDDNALKQITITLSDFYNEIISFYAPSLILGFLVYLQFKCYNIDYCGNS